MWRGVPGIVPQNINACGCPNPRRDGIQIARPRDNQPLNGRLQRNPMHRSAHFSASALWAPISHFCGLSRSAGGCRSRNLAHVLQDDAAPKQKTLQPSIGKTASIKYTVNASKKADFLLRAKYQALASSPLVTTNHSLPQPQLLHK